MNILMIVEYRGPGLSPVCHEKCRGSRESNPGSLTGDATWLSTLPWRLHLSGSLTGLISYTGRGNGTKIVTTSGGFRGGGGGGGAGASPFRTGI